MIKDEGRRKKAAARDIEALWLTALQEVIGKAAHEVKDALNGVTLNLEVIRSRAAGSEKWEAAALAQFANAATDQLEALIARTEAMLFLIRPQKTEGEPTDVGATLGHLAALLVPAARADGGRLEVEGQGRIAPTSASATAARLALASGLLALLKEGGGRCCLNGGADTVVRFSHESAGAGGLDQGTADALASHNIRVLRSDNDLQICFPGL